MILRGVSKHALNH